MKKNSLILLLFFITFSGSATHIVGGDMTVKHLSGNNFAVSMRFYRDCLNGATGFDNPIEIGLFDKVTNAYVDSFFLNLSTVTPVTLGDSCYAPNMCVEEGLFTGTIIIPNNPNGYYLSWERCCRNGIINNIVSPGAAGLTFYVEIPDPAIANSSPVFGAYARTYFCNGVQNTINFAATDIDGDNLVYSLTTPKNGWTTTAAPIMGQPVAGPYPTITWQSPYSLSNILGSTPNVSINPITGVLSVTPTTLGVFVFAVKAEEYRGGTKIGEITRDIQYQVVNCINPLTPGPAQVLTCTNPNVVITASSSGSVSSWNWTGPGVVSGGNTQSATVNVDGTYIVTTTSPIGCTYTATVAVTNNISYPNVAAGGSLALTCQSPSGTISASSSTSGVSYAWTGPGITAGAATSTPTVSAAGTYTVTVTNPNNGCTATATVAVTGSSNLPNVSTSSALSLTCTTTSGTITGASTTAGVTFSWAGPGIVGANNTATITANTGGTYTVTVTNPSNGCTSVGTIVINQNITPPNVSAPTSTVITCSTPTSTINVGSTTSGVTYVWSGPGIVSGGTTSSPIVNTTGTYTVVVTNPANGCTNSATVIVNNNITLPNVTAGSTLTLTCTSTSGTISANSTTPNAGYVWSGTDITANGNTSTPTVGATGTYTVVVTNPANGCTISATVIVNNNIVPPNAVAGTPLTLTCATGSGVITASSSTANVSYSWAGPNVVSGGTTSSATVNAAGTYTVTITNPLNGCTSTTTVLVSTDNSIPNLAASAALTLTCNAMTDTIFATSTTPNVTYAWSGPGIVSGGTTSSPIVSAAGTYTVVVTNPTSGCTNLTTVNVINNIIHPTIAAGSPQILNCLILSNTISVTSSTTGVTYSWSGPGIVSGSTTSSPIVNAAGTYIVTVTNPLNGCTSTTTVSVSKNITPPNITAGAAVTLTCSSTSSSISANSTTAGVTYNWAGAGIITGGNTSTPIVNAAGTYTVTVTNPVNGCTSTATVVVNSNVALPNVTAGNDLTLTCNITSSTVNANSTVAGALYTWSGPGIVSGGNTSSPIVNTAGTYTVTVTNPLNGCTSSTTLSVANAPLPVASVTATASLITLGNSTILTATGGGSYLWTPPTGLSCTTCASPIATPTVTTTYCVAVTDQYGCNDTACVKINVYDPCPVSNNGFLVPNVFSPNGDDKNDLLLLKDWNNECVVDFTFEIYDRWGLKMFEALGANIHWDGRTASGLECPDGTYYYIVNVRKVRAEAKTYKGFINLVR